MSQNLDVVHADIDVAEGLDAFVEFGVMVEVLVVDVLEDLTGSKGLEVSVVYGEDVVNKACYGPSVSVCAVSGSSNLRSPGLHTPPFFIFD